MALPPLICFGLPIEMHVRVIDVVNVETEYFGIAPRAAFSSDACLAAASQANLSPTPVGDSPGIPTSFPVFANGECNEEMMTFETTGSTRDDPIAYADRLELV